MGTTCHPVRRSRRRRDAFSLVELVVIIAVMAVFGAVAFPQYAEFVARRRIDSLTRRISADIGLVQREARFSGTEQTITFDTANETYTIVNMNDPDHPSEPYTVALGGPPFEGTIFSATFGAATQLTFDGYGFPKNGVGGEVVVGYGSWKKVIQVDANTGRTTVSDFVEVPDPPHVPVEPPDVL